MATSNGGVGRADVSGGTNPDPPIHPYPLLAWSPSHPQFGDDVFTEDGASSVEDIWLADDSEEDHKAIAARLGTTIEHVRQAIAYVRAREG